MGFFLQHQGQKTGTFKFDFYPDDDDYDDVRGSIRIEVSGSSSSSGKKVRLYVSPITLSSTSERLRDLEDELEDSVKAYYDGNSVRGDVSWEDSGSTQVKKPAPIPSSLSRIAAAIML